MCRIPVEKTDSFEVVLIEVMAALESEGFRVLNETNMTAIIGATLGQCIDSHIIPGVCKPELAYRKLKVEPDIGVLLPCNVVFRDMAKGAVSIAFTHLLTLLDKANTVQIKAIAIDMENGLVSVKNRLIEQARTVG